MSETCSFRARHVLDDSTLVESARDGLMLVACP
jgi:hypothetical protein